MTQSFGRAGASARAEFERRRARDEAERRATFGRWAPLARVLAGPKQTTESWGRGAQGEEMLGPWLEWVVGDRGVLLHDLALPRSRANLDHIAVVASGIWVIDSKHYRGRLERRDRGGCFSHHTAFTVAGRDQRRNVTAARRQQALVAEAVGAGPVVRAALCYTGVHVSPFLRPFVLEGVLITWPRALRRTLGRPGRLHAGGRQQAAEDLARRFPPRAA